MGCDLVPPSPPLSPTCYMERTGQVWDIPDLGTGAVAAELGCAIWPYRWPPLGPGWWGGMGGERWENVAALGINSHIPEWGGL